MPCCLQLLPGNLRNDMTELHQAAAAGDNGKVEEILRHNKCSLNERDIDWSNKTPLHWAAAKGHTEMVRVLIEHGARPCLRTVYGWTPAHFAAEYGHLAVLQVLHSFKAPMDKEDGCGDKPLRIAEIYGHQDCIQFLQKAETECQAYRKMAVQEGISLDDTDEEWAEHSKTKGRKLDLTQQHSEQRLIARPTARWQRKKGFHWMSQMKSGQNTAKQKEENMISHNIQLWV